MAGSKQVAPRNRLLTSMSAAKRAHFIARCEHVELSFAQVLCERDEPLRHVYFPLDSFVSLVTTLNGGARLEVGIVGDEGMMGTSLILGVNVSPQHVLVQGAGTALRMTAATFRRQYNQNVSLQRALNRYVFVVMSQLAQTAACTNFHVIEARLARWLLMTRDRAHANEFRLTQEFLAYMLGVQRVAVTQAAGSLHERGLITYSRGSIAILDGSRLEKASCRCYGNAIDMYDKTMNAA